MSEYGITDKGFVLKRYDTILKEVQADISESLGFDVSQNPQSMLNSALIIPFCDKLAELWEVSQDSYYSKYPSTADGVNLDHAVEFSNVKREPSHKTEYLIHCTAIDGTIIPEGSLISSITNPAIDLECVADTAVERAACNKISVRALTTSAGTYQIQINNLIATYDATANTTADAILKALQGKINAFEGFTTTYDANDKSLLIEDKVVSKLNDIKLSNNLTTKYVVSIVSFDTVEYGDFALPDETITKITSNVTGLQSVTNMVDRIPGRLVETDVELRQDYIRKSYATSSTLTDAIESYILQNVYNTSAARCFENDTDSTDSYGRPPHSIEVVVDGGDETQIARAILATKAGGIDTYGSIVTNVTGEYGDIITIRFSRPEIVYGWIKIELTPSETGVKDDYAEAVRRIIIDNTDLSIGDEFKSQQYIQSIYDEFTTLRFVKITVAKTSSLSTTPTSYAEGNLPATNRQKIVITEPQISVTLKS